MATEQAATLKADELNLFDSTVVAVSSVATSTRWRRHSACSLPLSESQADERPER